MFYVIRPKEDHREYKDDEVLMMSHPDWGREDLGEYRKLEQNLFWRDFCMEVREDLPKGDDLIVWVDEFCPKEEDLPVVLWPEYKHGRYLYLTFRTTSLKETFERLKHIDKDSWAYRKLTGERP
jgi:hypothetical protein